MWSHLRGRRSTTALSSSLRHLLVGLHQRGDFVLPGLQGSFEFDLRNVWVLMRKGVLTGVHQILVPTACQVETLVGSGRESQPINIAFVNHSLVRFIDHINQVFGLHEHNLP